MVDLPKKVVSLPLCGHSQRRTISTEWYKIWSLPL